MGLIENLVALFSSWFEEEAEPSWSSSAEPSTSASASTSFPATGITSTNNNNTSTNDNNNMSKKKLAQKLKGYFELGKEEINKAISAEEWGLPADAIVHYVNAQAIFAEAMSTQVTLDSSSGSEEIKEYQGKILKWQGKVAERLKELGRRSGPRIKQRTKSLKNDFY